MDDFSIYNLYGDWTDWQQLQPTFKIRKVPEIENQLINQGMNSKEKVCSSILTSQNENFSYQTTRIEERAVSAYAIFFRERQPLAKARWPEATFGDYSKIIAAEWESLDAATKKAYKQHSERVRRQQIRSAALTKAKMFCRKLETTRNEEGADRKQLFCPLESTGIEENTEKHSEKIRDTVTPLKERRQN